MTPKYFPMLWQPLTRQEEAELERLGCPKSVPWSFVEPHEKQALANHDQTLVRLAERGGLSPAEMLAVVQGRRWRSRTAANDPDAVPVLLELLKAHVEAQRRTRTPAEVRQDAAAAKNAADESRGALLDLVDGVKGYLALNDLEPVDLPPRSPLKIALDRAESVLIRTYVPMSSAALPLCPECGEQTFDAPGGITCPQGHGGLVPRP